MVLAGKIFKIREETDIRTIAQKLKGYRREETVNAEGKSFTLLTEITDLSMRDSSVHGVFAEDALAYIYHHGDLTPIVKTVEAPFMFSTYNNKTLLVVLEKKRKANDIANKLSQILFITAGYITEAKIPVETMKEFHEKNLENTKIVFFDDVDIPNINKLSLYGESLATTSLYDEYSGHGNIWYIVITARGSGHVIGVTRNSVVTVFSRTDETEFLEYVEKEIFPLIS
jgi:hypothetical protein